MLRTVAYADVFDQPLTLTEVHRYLVGLAAPLADVRAGLGRLVPERLARRGGMYMLRGREGLVESRRRRSAAAARLWPEAVRYGRVLAGLPFVRMVAVTGSLARDAVDSRADIDYLVVTAAGRVWVGRGLTGVVRRAGRLRGIRLCPNYVLSERALVLADRNLFTAYELVQMVPLAGEDLYGRMRRLNGWTAEFVPNADGRPRGPAPVTPGRRRLARVSEIALRTRVGGWLERAEWARFERKLPSRTSEPKEVVYSADCFKDHVDGWAERVLADYTQRVSAVGVKP